jgi:hypothetical protein
MRQGQPVQVIAAPQPLPLPILDLRPVDEKDQPSLVRRLVSWEVQQPFDLALGPLVRTTLLRLHPAEHILLLTLHHIVSDGWSLGVLVRELAALYTPIVEGRPAMLPPLPIQYADFAVWQRQWLQGPALTMHLVYWRQQLAGAPSILELPTDYPHPAVQRFRGGQAQFVLPNDLGTELVALSRRVGGTLFMTVLAAFQVLLARYTGQTDIVVGTPVANRMRVGTEQMIGFFVNTLVLRTDLAGNPSFLNLLQRVREVCLGAYAHQDLPFEQLVEALQPPRHVSYHPLVQVMVALQNAPRTLRCRRSSCRT